MSHAVMIGAVQANKQQADSRSLGVKGLIYLIAGKPCQIARPLL